MNFVKNKKKENGRQISSPPCFNSFILLQIYKTPLTQKHIIFNADEII